jgi:RNase P subunit RPR2
MKELICVKCNVPLVEQKTDLRYLGHPVSVEVPRCPECGQVCFSAELVRGGLSEAEMTLEDK